MPQPGILDQDLVERSGEDSDVSQLLCLNDEYMCTNTGEFVGYTQNQGPPPGEAVDTVLLINANQPAGTILTVDDTGNRTLTNEAYNGGGQVAPPKTGTPAVFGANALLPSVDAFDLSSTAAFSQTYTEYTTDLDISAEVDFMFEVHVRFTNSGEVAADRVFAEVYNSAGYRVFEVLSNDRTVKLRVDGNTVGDAIQVPVNDVAHIVVTRSGSLWKMYQDGIKVALIDSTPVPQVDNAFRARLVSRFEDQPIFDAARMVMGGEVYYDAFDVPTTEPGEVTTDPGIGGRVVFLANGENGALGSRPATEDLNVPLTYNHTTGGYVNSNTGPVLGSGGKWGQCYEPISSGSDEFPSYPNSAVWSDPFYKFSITGTRNLCIEGHLQRRTTSGEDFLGIIWSTWTGAVNGTSPVLGLGITDDSVKILKGGSTLVTFDVSGENMQQMNHFALVLEDGIGKVYMNGTYIGETPSEAIDTFVSARKVFWRGYNGNQRYYEMALVDAVRITLGSPVYTGNFPAPLTPPTTTLP